MLIQTLELLHQIKLERLYQPQQLMAQTPQRVEPITP